VNTPTVTAKGYSAAIPNYRKASLAVYKEEVKDPG
jgi:hypothetical protein